MEKWRRVGICVITVHLIGLRSNVLRYFCYVLSRLILFVHSYLCCAELSNCPFFVCVWNSSDPNGKILFHASIMNNKVLLFHAFIMNNKVLLCLYLGQAIRATLLRQDPSFVLDSHKQPKQCKVSSVHCYI